MIIGIEAERANNPQKTGVEHYAKQLILHLAEIDRKNQYILFLRTKPQAWFLKLPENFKIKVMPFPIFWTQIRISLEMLFKPVDVLMIPASALPLIHPKKSVITIHDIAWKFYPGSFTWFNRNFLEWSTKFALSASSHVIAVSDATKNDLIKHYRIPDGKITVVHHGYEEKSKIQNPKSKILRDLPERFILFLSTLQPRKNLEGLIEAFKQLKKEHPELPHKLVVVGRTGWKYKAILKKMAENQEWVIYLNYVSDDDRLAILSKADLLVLPSFYEGFGMQILESFAAGVPVATSNVSSMPEVAGEAAVYFNPHNFLEIKSAMSAVLFDQSLADRLREKGKQRLKDFSWRKCAEETLRVIES